MVKTLSNGQTLETKGYTVYINGMWAANDGPHRLAAPFDRDGQTYTYRIGKFAFTDAEIEIMDQEEQIEKEAFARMAETESAKEQVENRHDDLYNEGGEGYNPYRGGK